MMLVAVALVLALALTSMAPHTQTEYAWNSFQIRIGRATCIYVPNPSTTRDQASIRKKIKIYRINGPYIN
jgi:hypothetical protein